MPTNSREFYPGLSAPCVLPDAFRLKPLASFKASSENRTRNSSLAKRWVTTTPWTHLLAQPSCQRSRSGFRLKTKGIRKIPLACSLKSLASSSVGSVGIEPTLSGLRIRCITLSATNPGFRLKALGCREKRRSRRGTYLKPKA